MQVSILYFGGKISRHNGDYVVESMKSVMKFLKILHWVGLTMVIAGSWLYLGTDLTQQLSGMLMASILLGLGLVLMAPFPVLLVIDWARGQADESKDT